MEPSLEIRKLPISHRTNLINILESGEAWKKVMAIIPKTLEKNNYECEVTLENMHKYNSEHFKILTEASDHYKKRCTDILLDEWGTSGRVRPALGHLLYLLTKAELYRAADYVSIDLLNKEPVKRPKRGPAAEITADLSKYNPKREEELKRIEKILDEIDYPSSAIENIKNSTINTNMNYTNPTKASSIPKIIISESPDEDEIQDSVFNLPLVYQSSQRRNNDEVSDMIKFSTEQVFPELPDVSLLNNTKKSEPQLSDSNNCSKTSPSGDFENSNKSSQLSTSESVNAIIPNLSQFNTNSSNNEVRRELNGYSSELPVNLPNLSAFQNSENETNIPAFSQLISSNNNVPNISSLLNNETKTNEINNQNTILTASANSSSILNIRTQETNSLTPNQKSSSRPLCTSPLPNLSLNTLLPHFNYYELEIATDNFNELSVLKGGRFLGSGAFGMVYLATGLLDMQTAVKKIVLENTEVVKIDDEVTKQFRTEVEILSKYKHENLLSLLGYSCDGPTYCLLYEYIPGGALKDRLKNQENKLIWTERLYVAIGTAKAICYLHSVKPTPLIHRDVKTANILLDVTNKPKLCDFGLIKLLPNQNTSRGTRVFGTSAYMAPEAFRGEISVKMDTFSFGVVLLELLTSLPPLDENREGCDLITHVLEICEEGIDPLLDTSAGSWIANNINFSAELYKIAKNCIKDKKERPRMVEVTVLLGDLVHNSI